MVDNLPKDGDFYFCGPVPFMKDVYHDSISMGIEKEYVNFEMFESGTVQINNKTERGPDHFPFLGVKASGMGTQGVRYSIESMSRPKATVITLSIHN